MTIPDGYEPKHGFNFIPGGIKIKIATILPVSQKAPEGKVPADLCTAFEVILCPDVIDDPELGGSYYYHRRDHDLGRPPNGTRGSSVRLTCGQKEVTGVGYEWDHNGTTVIRYQVFPNKDVQVVAVGPKNRFDESAFHFLLRSMAPDDAVNY